MLSVHEDSRKLAVLTFGQQRNNPFRWVLVRLGVVAWTGVHVLKLWTFTASQPLDHVFTGEPQGGVLTLFKSV